MQVGLVFVSCVVRAVRAGESCDPDESYLIAWCLADSVTPRPLRQSAATNCALRCGGVDGMEQFVRIIQELQRPPVSRFWCLLMFDELTLLYLLS